MRNKTRNSYRHLNKKKRLYLIEIVILTDRFIEKRSEVVIRLAIIKGRGKNDRVSINETIYNGAYRKSVMDQFRYSRTEGKNNNIKPFRVPVCRS